MEEQKNDGNEPRKFCPKCCLWKSLSCFYARNLKNPKVKEPYCKQCRNKKQLRDHIKCPHCKKAIVFRGVDDNGYRLKPKKNHSEKYEDRVETEVEETFLDEE